MADHSTRIAEIETILRSGVRRVVNDGTDITHDFDALRSELRKLKSDDDTNRGRRRAQVAIDLGGYK